ncbi:MAG: DNA polymerase III subunit delta' [Caldimicrobium sp.]|nr:DNA polymerase III subunit delta' [Caldimicrobium sp.]MCX7873736.1 DNA polymerase III subunit delta' [Caldimicrobium sp.]MDW8093660.1 DNA polymerase III subunit delta' [Caldimicrobium sp.]
MIIIRNINEIIGQEPAINLLRSALQKKRLAQCYLFSGPEGVGKETTAKALLYHLFCQISSISPCGTCLACKKLTKGIHPDVMIITPEKRDIRIDSVREGEKFLRYPPLEGQYRVIIILHADRLNPEAGNALLKSLEEPPLFALFILTTENQSQILPTILSRSQIVRFRTLAEKHIKEYLIKYLACDEVVAKSIAEVSLGSLGKAVEIFKGGLLEELNRFVKVTLSKREDLKLMTIEKLAKQERSYLELLLYLLGLWYWRSYLHLKIEYPYPKALPEEKFKGNPFESLSNLALVKKALENFVNPELALYILTKNIPH